MATTKTVTARSQPGGLSYETAAQHPTRDVPVVGPGLRIRDAREILVSRRYDSASHIVVCEAEQFRGVTTIEDALAAPADASVASRNADVIIAHRRSFHLE